MISIQDCDKNLNLNDKNSLSSGTDSICDELKNLLKLKEQQHDITNSCLLSLKKQDISYLQLRRLETELETYNIEQKIISRKINIL